MRFNCGPDFRPTRGVHPDAAIFYGELCSGCMFDKFWPSRTARLPFSTPGAGDEFCKTGGDKRGCVRFTVTFDLRVQQLGHATQNVYGAVFGIAAETNHCWDVEVEFPKRLRQAVCGPVLFLARDAGAGTKVSNEIGLGED